MFVTHALAKRDLGRMFVDMRRRSGPEHHTAGSLSLNASNPRQARPRQTALRATHLPAPRASEHLRQ
jgi:hypothetical protein